MKIINNSNNEIILRFHSKCKNLIFDTLGISEMRYGDLFISGWYLGGLLLAYSLRMLRSGVTLLSVITLFLSIVYVLLLAVLGLIKGYLKNKVVLNRRKDAK